MAAHHAETAGNWASSNPINDCHTRRRSKNGQIRKSPIPGLSPFEENIKSEVSSTNQGWKGERQDEIKVMVRGEESLHPVCLCILEHNYPSTARVQPILTFNYNTYKLVQPSKAS